MTKLERDEFERLITLKTVTMTDKQSAITLYKKYIDKNTNYCLTCAESVRQLFKNTTNWYKKQNQNYTFIKEL